MGYTSNFSPDGRLFALLDSDGKLKIWNIKENRLVQEYVPDLHLSHPYTCFVWLEDGTWYIALGTSKGGVDLYSHASGKVESKLKGNGHAGAVTSICLYSDKKLYTSGEDCKIFEWSLQTCSYVRDFPIDNITPTYIVWLPISDTLLVGCKELHQWSLGKQPRKVSALTGHKADISSMKVIESTDKGAEYVVTTAKNNREIFLWKIGSKKNPKGTFLMEHVGSVVSCSFVDSKLTIAAVTHQAVGASSGVAHLFAVDDIRDIGKKPTYPKPTLTVAFDSGSSVAPISIVAATTTFSRTISSNILIGYGNSPTLFFEEVLYDPSEKKQTFERTDPRTQRRPENGKDSKTIISKIDGTTHIGTPYKTPRRGKETFEDRVISLSGTPIDHNDKGHSLVETLKQALSNNDAENIRTVLSTKDENVIRSTLKRLPAPYVTSLIDQLTLLTHKKTSNVQIAVRWLKLLLQIHASQLMALGKDELIDRFGALLGILQNRTHCLAQLTALSGRLDFLMNQIKRNTDDDPIFNHENLLVYEDKASDAEGSDANGANSNSDGGVSTDEADDVHMSGSTDDEESIASM